MKKRELAAAGALTVLAAAMDISGLPAAWFVRAEVLDIEPVYWALMGNFALLCAAVGLGLRRFCPGWPLGLHGRGLAAGLRRYGWAGAAAGLASGAAFYLGLRPLDAFPTVWKVLVEGVVYYFGVALVEELYVRGLLLNLLERLRGRTAAVAASSLLFALGHVPGAWGLPPAVIAAKVVWTAGMGLYFGAAYKRSGCLWLPILLHWWIDVCALPYCFSTARGYPPVSLSILVPVYLLLGLYGLRILREQ